MTGQRTIRARRGSSRVLVAVVAACLGVAACSSGGGADSSSSGPAATKGAAELQAELQKPATITFWSWVPDIQSEIDLFEKKYPNITVKLVNAGQGAAEYTKLRTAVKAAGAPDVVQLEASEVPSFTITNDLLDLAPYGANTVKDKFVDWTWGQVSQDGKVFGIPQDTGPMGLLYRKDLFDKYGITVPKTWDEFATAARKLHAANPSVYLTNFPATDNAPLFGLGWQAGARPFSVTSRSEIGISLTDDGMKKVADFWTPLIRDGVISADPDFTDQWFKGLASGKYASWIGAAWGPAFLQGSVKATSGKWRAAPLPQWAAGENKAGNWGGSVTSVTKSTKSPVAAAAFAQFLNTDPASTQLFATKQILYPATKAVLADPAFVGQEYPFYGGQKVNEVFAGISTGITTDFQWSPFQDYVASSSNDTVGKAASAKQDLSAGLTAWEQAVVTYAKKQGFTVTGK
jgi:multiple sugar transport system substrate-binding protein